MLERSSFAAVGRYVRRLFTALTLSYVVVCLFLGGKQAARPAFQVSSLLWSLLLAPWALQLFAHAQRAGWHVRVLSRFGIVGFNVSLALVLVEGSLAGFARLAGQSLVVSNSLDAYRLRPGHDYGFGLLGNDLGYPGPELTGRASPGTRRIAALGDSFAVGASVPFDANYLTRLGKTLPDTAVYNLGVSGTGPREYHLLLRRDVLRHRPDLVLVSVFVGNDITETLATPRHLSLAQHATYLLLSRGWRLLTELGCAKHPASGDMAGRLTAGRLSERAFADVEGRRLAICIPGMAPTIEKKWQQALGHLDAIIGDCHSAGIPVAFVLIPDEFQVNPEVRALACRNAGVLESELDPSLPQRRLLAFFAARQTSCLDLLPVFGWRADAYAPRDTHWNETGHRLAADALVAWLCDDPRLLASAPRTPAP